MLVSLSGFEFEIPYVGSGCLGCVPLIAGVKVVLCHLTVISLRHSMMERADSAVLQIRMRKRDSLGIISVCITP